MNNSDYKLEDIEQYKRDTLEMYEQNQHKISFWGTKDRTASKVGMKQKSIAKRRNKNKAAKKARKAS